MADKLLRICAGKEPPPPTPKKECRCVWHGRCGECLFPDGPKKPTPAAA